MAILLSIHFLNSLLFRTIASTCANPPVDRKYSSTSGVSRTQAVSLRPRGAGRPGFRGCCSVIGFLLFCFFHNHVITASSIQTLIAHLLPAIRFLTLTVDANLEIKSFALQVSVCTNSRTESPQRVREFDLSNLSAHIAWFNHAFNPS